MSKQEMIKSKLLEKKKVVEERLKMINKDMRRVETGQLETDMEDQSIAVQNDEVIDALDRQGRKELRNINLAMEDIKKSKSGICHQCGKKIPYSRLRALPEALYCIQCASA